MAPEETSTTHKAAGSWILSPTFRRVTAEDIITCDQGGLLSITVASQVHVGRPTGKKDLEVDIQDVIEVELLFSEDNARDFREALDTWLKAIEARTKEAKK